MSLLASGAAAAANTETYVAACRTLGVGAAELSADTVRQMWAAEDGLSLSALDADSAALQRAADAAEEGLRAQREALALLSEAWQGSAGGAAVERLARHCAATDAAVAGLRDAGAVLGALRDRLGHLLAAKADAAVRIDCRVDAGSGLLADAAAVIGGTADGSAADAVRQHVAPYVDADVRAEWVSAMRTATESVAAAYEQSAARLAEHEPARAAPPVAAPPAAQAPPAPPAPAGSGGPASVPDLSGLLPPVADIGAPLGGLVAQIAHVAELLGDDLEPEPAEPEPAEPENTEPEPAERAEPAAKRADTATRSLSQPAAAVPASAAAQPAEPVESVGPVRPVEPVPAAEPAAGSAAPAEPDADRTPCEIAADDLPQAGP